MIRSVDSKIETYDGMFEFIKQVSELTLTGEVQPRYRVGWTRAEIEQFLSDFGREAMQLLAMGVISDEEVSYQSYIYRPHNKLILIYEAK